MAYALQKKLCTTARLAGFSHRFPRSRPMRTVRFFVQHYFNPLHVYCRLREIGVNTCTAQRFCTVYERFVYRAFRF